MSILPGVRTRVFLSGSLPLSANNVVRFLPLEDALERGGCEGAAEADASAFGNRLEAGAPLSTGSLSDQLSTMVTLGVVDPKSDVYGLCLANMVTLGPSGLAMPIVPGNESSQVGRRRTQSAQERALVDEDFVWRPDITVVVSDAVPVSDPGDALTLTGANGLTPLGWALLAALLALCLCCCCCYFCLVCYRRREAAKMTYHRRDAIDQGRPRDLRESFKKRFGIEVRPPSISARETSLADVKMDEAAQGAAGADEHDEVVQEALPLLARMMSLIAAEPAPPPEKLAEMREGLNDLELQLNRRLLPEIPVAVREMIDNLRNKFDELELCGCVYDPKTSTQPSNAALGAADAVGAAGAAGAAGAVGAAVAAGAARGDEEAGSGSRLSSQESKDMKQLLEIADLQADIKELTLRLQRRILSTDDLRMSAVSVADRGGSIGDLKGLQDKMVSKNKPGVTFVSIEASQADSQDSLDAAEPGSPKSPSSRIFSRMFSYFPASRKNLTKSTKAYSAKLRMKSLWSKGAAPPPPSGPPPEQEDAKHTGRSGARFFHVFGAW